VFTGVSFFAPNTPIMNNTMRKNSDYIFDMESFLKDHAISDIKNKFFKETKPFHPMASASNYFYDNVLEDLLRMHSPGAHFQGIKDILAQTRKDRRWDYAGTTKFLWDTYVYLADYFNDDEFAFLLKNGLPFSTDKDVDEVHNFCYENMLFLLAHRMDPVNTEHLKRSNFIVIKPSPLIEEECDHELISKDDKIENSKKNIKNYKISKKIKKIIKTLLGGKDQKNDKNLKINKKKSKYVNLNKQAYTNKGVSLMIDSPVYDKMIQDYRTLIDKIVLSNRSIRQTISVINKFHDESVLEPQSFFNTKHDVSTNVKIDAPNIEINGLTSLLGVSGKPVISISRDNPISSRGDDTTELAKLENSREGMDSESYASYKTAKESWFDSILNSVFSWFKNFNFDHVILLNFALVFMIHKIDTSLLSMTTKKTLAVALLGASLYLSFMNLQRNMEFMESMLGTKPLSESTFEYFYNSNFYSMIWKCVSYLVTGSWEVPASRIQVVNREENSRFDATDPIVEEIPMESLEPQISIGNEGILKTAAGVFIAYLATSCKVRPTSHTTSMLMNFLNTRDFAIDNVITMLQSATTLLQDVINYFFKIELNFAKAFDISKFKTEEARLFVDKINDKIINYNTGVGEINIFDKVVFHEDIQEGNKLMRGIERNSYDYLSIQQVLREYEKLAVQYKVNEQSLSGSRVEPVGILLRGPPGIKKTILLNRMARVVTKFTIPGMWKDQWEQNPDDFVYNIPTDKFWDGYTYKAWVAITDDLFQARDAVGDVDSEALKIIRMINCNPYVLQMADVATKNTKFFRSAFVMASTNLMDFSQLEAIRDYKAVRRRFHIVVDVSVNPSAVYNDEYDDTINVNSKSYQTSMLPNDYWTFKVNDKEVSFGDIIKASVAYHQTHVANYISNIASTHVATCTAKLNDDLTSDIYSDAFLASMTAPGTLFSSIKNENERLLNNLIETDGNRTKQHRNTKKDKIMERQVYNEHVAIDISDYIMDKEMGEKIGLTRLRTSDFELDDENSFGTKQRSSLMAKIALAKGSLANSNLGTFLSCFSSGVIKKMIERLEIGYPFVSDFAYYNDYNFCLNTQEINSIIYLYKGSVTVDFDLLISKIKPAVIVSAVDKRIEETKIPTMMEECASFLTSKIKQLFITIKENAVLITALSFIGFGAFKLIQGILSYFYPDEPFFIIPLEDLERQSDSPSNYHAKTQHSKAKHRSKPKEEKDNRDRVNWEGKPDSRRGLRLKKVRRQGLSLDNFNTDILAKIEIGDVDIPNCNDIATRVLNKYYFISYLRNVETDNMRKIGMIINLTGNIFVMPAHFSDAIYTDTSDDSELYEIVMVTPNKRLIYRMPCDDFLNSCYYSDASVDDDIMYVELRNTQLNSCGILKYIISDSDLDTMKKCTKVPSTLVSSSLSPSGNTISYRHVKSKMDTTQYMVKSEAVNVGYVLSKTFSYSSDTQRGDCGALLFSNMKNNNGRCIMGFHVAGLKDFGVSAILTRESIESDMKSIGLRGSPIQEEDDLPLETVYENTLNTQSGITVLGKVPQELAAPIPFKSSIKKSRFYGNLPAPYDNPDTMPAHLKPFYDKEGNFINPHEKALHNYGKDVVSISNILCNLSVSSYGRIIMKETADYIYDRKVLITFDEALHGFRGVGPITSSTSPGWPMNLDKNNPKKAYFSERSTQEEKLAAYEELKRQFNEALDKYKQGVRPVWLYVDCLKDEKRAMEKWLSGSTRLYSAGMFIYLLLVRVYFGAFMAAYIEKNIIVGSGVGVNPYGDQWSIIVDRLRIHGERQDGIHVGAGDFSKFDGHEQPYLLNGVLDIINTWYGHDDKEGNKIRTALWAEITNSRHIYGQTVYEWIASMPSGNPLTIIINTMYNQLCFRYAWLEGDLDISEFNKNVTLIAVGDDCIYSVSEKYEDYFNELLMSNLMKKVGMVYTTETKGEAVVKFRKITEVEFLKRSFRKSARVGRRLYDAPLRLSATIEILNWTKKGMQDDEIAVDNVGVVLRELSLHGRTTYDYWFPILSSLLHEHYEGMIPKGIYSADHSVVYNEVVKDTSFRY